MTVGYSTDFSGGFNIDKPLAPEHKAYLEAFADIRHMQRDAGKTAALPDPIREAVGLQVGIQGAYYVGDNDSLYIFDNNKPPHGVPELFCQWIPNEDGTAIVWDGGEKFYGYVPWIEYLIKNFLAPWGYTLNGQVEWSGEEPGDSGVIYIKDNKVKAVRDTTNRKEPNWD